MKCSLKISYSTWIRNLTFGAVIVLFAFDVRTFLGNAVPISIITSGVFLILLFCFYFLFLFPYRDPLAKVNIRNLDILMFVFMLWYGLRMVYNIYIQQIEQTTFVNRSTYIVYYMFLCVLPYLLCRWINWKMVNIKKMLWTLFFIFIFGLLVSLRAVVSLLMSGDNAYEGRFEANRLLDTIGYGHLALSFVLVCFSLMRFYATRWRFVLLLPVCFGLVSMGIANSRSPFVALFIILGIFCLQRIKLKTILWVVALCLLVVFYVEYIDLFFQEYFHSNFISRLLTIFTFNLENASGRGAFYQEGIRMFLDNPVLGKSVLLTGSLSGGYVHNMIIEVFMAIGLVGGLLFLFINFRVFQHAYFLLKRNSRYSFFALIFIQYFIFLQFSRSISLLPVYWTAFACVFSGYLLEKSNESSDSYGLL